MSEQQVKSKQRVSDHGEVFTASKEVKAMCDLVNKEIENIHSRVLEPTCGSGNFLAEILIRKLAVVKANFAKTPYDYELFSFLAVTSLYGVDLLLDNAKECQQRLFDIWYNEYAQNVNQLNTDCIDAVHFVLNKNIVCGDMLSLCKQDGSPIMFSEWCFDGCLVKRKDFNFHDILESSVSRQNKGGQTSLFEGLNDDEISNEPVPVKEFDFVRYSKVQFYE